MSELQDISRTKTWVMYCRLTIVDLSFLRKIVSNKSRGIALEINDLITELRRSVEKDYQEYKKKK